MPHYDNCGLPDGMVHMHTERCYRAGFKAGYDQAIEEMRDLEDRNAVE